MENVIANTTQSVRPAKMLGFTSFWSQKLFVFTLILAVGILAISIELQIPSVLAFYEELQLQLDTLEKLLEDLSSVMGSK